MEQKFNKWTQLLNCKELNGNERIVLALILNYHKENKTIEVGTHQIEDTITNG